MRVSFSAVRAITKVIRGEAGQRGEGTLEALDLQLPLQQNLRDAGQAWCPRRLFVGLDQYFVTEAMTLPFFYICRLW